MIYFQKPSNSAGFKLFLQKGQNPFTGRKKYITLVDMKKKTKPPSTRERLLKSIEVCLESCGISETAFGLAVANDSKLIPQMRRGRNVTLEMYDTILRHMEKLNSAGGV